MNTQEAIQFLEQLKISNVYTPESYRKHLKDTQELLQQGEKYKKYKLIIEKYKEYLDKLPTGCDSLKFYRLLKKYFPKEMIK